MTSPAGRAIALHAKPETAGERGLPKAPREEIEVGPGGVGGDFNRYRQELLAGDPDSALLLLPAETLEELREEGWPVAPGDLGENVTTRGIPAADLAAGLRLRLGDDVVVELSRRCDPCRNLRVLPYVGRDRLAAFVETLVGRRGWYARIVRPGRLRRGDPIAIAGPSDSAVATER